MTAEPDRFEIFNCLNCGTIAPAPCVDRACCNADERDALVEVARLRSALDRKATICRIFHRIADGESFETMNFDPKESAALTRLAICQGRCARWGADQCDVNDGSCEQCHEEGAALDDLYAEIDSQDEA
jgi:hypothetical protein